MIRGNWIGFVGLSRAYATIWIVKAAVSRSMGSRPPAPMETSCMEISIATIWISRNSLARAAQAMTTLATQRNMAVISKILYGNSYRYISAQISSSTNVARYGSNPAIAPTAIPTSKSPVSMSDENGSLRIWSKRFFIDVVVSRLAIRIGLWSLKRLPDNTPRGALPERLKVSIPIHRQETVWFDHLECKSSERMLASLPSRSSSIVRHSVIGTQTGR